MRPRSTGRASGTDYGQIFRIGTVRYAEGLWRKRRHGPVIAHCTDSEYFPDYGTQYWRVIVTLLCLTAAY